jgi:hypothetical protein
MFRNGFVDWRTSYTAPQLVWEHTGSGWDVVAVLDQDAKPSKEQPARPANGSYA